MVLEKFRQINVDWDISNQYQNSPTVKVVAGGSTNSQLLTVSVLNAGKREDLSEVSALFSWRNLTTGDNGNTQFEPYDVNAGSFQIALPSSMLGVKSKGQVTANIVLTKPEPDGFLITSRALSFVIEESALTSVAFADDEQSNLFQEILKNWQKLPDDYASTISAANIAAASLASSLSATAASVNSTVSSAADSVNSAVYSIADSVNDELSSTASSFNASVASEAAQSAAYLASSLAQNVSSANDIVTSLIAGDASMDSYLQSHYSAAETSMVSMATDAINGLLGDSAAVTLDSLVIDNSTAVASYQENVTTADGTAVSKPMTTTTSFWSTLKNWIIGLIFDDTTVAKILPFRKGGTGTNAISAGLVKSNGTMLVPAVPGTDFPATSTVNSLTVTASITFQIGYGVTIYCVKYGKVVVGTVDTATPTSPIPATDWTAAKETIPEGWRPASSVWLNTFRNDGNANGGQTSWFFSFNGSIGFRSGTSSINHVWGSVTWLLP